MPDAFNGVSDEVRALNPGVFDAVDEPRKYRNKPMSTDGMRFDSGKEAADAQAFILGVRNGDFISYQHHIRFPLAGGIIYESDHVLINNDLSVSVYDSKGFRTREYLQKRKLFKERYGRDIIEI